ncbi:hypothetical protein BBK82_35575 [Lentzea guizhouensis]|uniref:Thioesterase domain-containing protein n=1 Tax=Lentzea guizhouensis TaxID=1586287 RepID=A0A1B2HS37_9PSEU|nr:thioesterase domain-containing protein [Lentzea guizhouensis]ANZ40539.1 hypothetical protein BBK82_35575 [Lentzea guizhouensis]
MPEQRRWVVERAARPDPVATLYCFPHAGGAAGEFVRWAAELPRLRVAAVQPPGRAHQLGEHAFTAMAPLVDAVLAGVRFVEPFALFGHSLGALVAFEVAKSLRAHRGITPVRLFVSSCTAPPLPVSRAPLHLLDDRELHAEIERRWGPLPAAVRADDRLLSAALACYRADFAVLETHEHVPDTPLGCPITAFVGDGERGGAQRMLGWGAHTAKTFDLCQRPGGHFHVRDGVGELCRLIDHTVTTDVHPTHLRMST